MLRGISWAVVSNNYWKTLGVLAQELQQELRIRRIILAPAGIKVSVR
jgi:hypothetical protein